MERPKTLFERLARERGISVEEMRAIISARIEQGMNEFVGMGSIDMGDGLFPVHDQGREQPVHFLNRLRCLVDPLPTRGEQVSIAVIGIFRRVDHLIQRAAPLCFAAIAYIRGPS